MSDLYRVNLAEVFIESLVKDGTLVPEVIDRQATMQLTDQDLAVLIGLCTDEMEAHPYWVRSVFLSDLIDRLEAMRLAQ